MSPVEEFVARQAAEYGKYTATAPIFIGGTRAFNPGDPVPVTHVEPDDQFGILAAGQVTTDGDTAPVAEPVSPETNIQIPPPVDISNEG